MAKKATAVKKRNIKSNTRPEKKDWKHSNTEIDPDNVNILHVKRGAIGPFGPILEIYTDADDDNNKQIVLIDSCGESGMRDAAMAHVNE